MNSVKLLLGLLALAGIASPQSINGITNQNIVTPLTIVNCALMSGADDSLKIQACFNTLYNANSQAGVADARGLTGGTWSVNPFATTNIPTSGTLLLPPGNITVSVPIVAKANWSTIGTSTHSENGANYALGSVPAGTVLKASSTFPTTYTTGTVTVGTAGLNEVVTGAGTSWTANIVPGCAFVAAASFPNGTATYGIIKSVDSNTQLTLAFGVNNGGGAASAGSAYAVFCPIYVHGNGASNGDGFDYGMAIKDLSISANNRAGVVPELNWFGGQHTYGEDVDLYDFCGTGLMIEGNYAQNSGPWDRIGSYPGTCGGATSVPFQIAIQGSGFFGAHHLSVNKGMASVQPNIGVNVEGQGIGISDVDAEQVGIGVSVDNNTTCNPACAWESSWIAGGANTVEIDSVHGSGTTAVKLGNVNGNPRNTVVRNIQSAQFSNTLIDTGNSCTITQSPEYGLGEYATNSSGQIVVSTSTTCLPSISATRITSGGIYTGSSSNKDTAGQLTLTSGTASYTFTGTYTSAPICTAADTTAANPVKVTTNTTALTLTGTGTDVLNYVCVGRN